MTLGWRNYVVFGLYVAVTVVFIALDEIPQDPSYHLFADDRTIWGITNFFDAVSNAAFLVPGVAGLWLCLMRPPASARWSWTTVFVGVCAVVAGSWYYHLAPSDGRLFWDRLPMTVGFTALFVALVEEYVAERTERILLIPAVVVGVAGLLYWVWSGDLRAYFWIQAISLGTLIAIVSIYRDSRREHSYLIAAALAYGAAVVSEQADARLYEVLQHALGGHAIKHVLAAVGLYQLFRMLRDRTRTYT